MPLRVMIERFSSDRHHDVVMVILVEVSLVELEVLRTVLSRLNSATRAAAATTGALLVDLERSLDGDASAFYDDCHFTEAGAARVAEEIAAVLSAGDRAFRSR